MSTPSRFAIVSCAADHEHYGDLDAVGNLAQFIQDGQFVHRNEYDFTSLNAVLNETKNWGMSALNPHVAIEYRFDDKKNQYQLIGFQNLQNNKKYEFKPPVFLPVAGEYARGMRKPFDTLLNAAPVTQRKTEKSPVVDFHSRQLNKAILKLKSYADRTQDAEKKAAANYVVKELQQKIKDYNNPNFQMNCQQIINEKSSVLIDPYWKTLLRQIVEAIQRFFEAALSNSPESKQPLLDPEADRRDAMDEISTSLGMRR